MTIMIWDWIGLFVALTGVVAGVVALVCLCRVKDIVTRSDTEKTRRWFWFSLITLIVCTIVVELISYLV